MEFLLNGRGLRWTRFVLFNPSTRHGKKRAQNKILKPTSNNNFKERLPMVVIGPSGIKANKMVGHIQHNLNVLDSLKC
jgi:hypothetical protein